jgi:hypothetical protein
MKNLLISEAASEVTYPALKKLICAKEVRVFQLLSLAILPTESA